VRVSEVTVECGKASEDRTACLNMIMTLTLPLRPLVGSGVVMFLSPSSAEDRGLNDLRHGGGLLANREIRAARRLLRLPLCPVATGVFFKQRRTRSHVSVQQLPSGMPTPPEEEAPTRVASAPVVPTCWHDPLEGWSVHAVHAGYRASRWQLAGRGSAYEPRMR
jgi:hypothetical protein